jgi:ArsR family transcriptional regulator, arsenate/arsenite/antimonite-responsive transcriptional repressor
MSLDNSPHFNIYRNMKKPDAVAALAALAQENRLDTFRLLVQAGPDGMPAGEVAEALDVAPNTLTFHLDRLREAGLVSVRREGRSMIYSARYETMNGLLAYLTENCCQGADRCTPARRKASSSGRVREKERVS